MKIWFVPTNPEHLDACLLTGFHATNAHNFNAKSGDLVVTYLTEVKQIVAISVLVGDPFTSDALNTLWSKEYNTLFRLQPIELLSTPIDVVWARSPGLGSHCPRYSLNPAVGPQEISPSQFATILEDVQANA